MKTILILFFASIGLFSDVAEVSAVCLILCCFLSAIAEPKKFDNSKNQ